MKNFEVHDELTVDVPPQVLFEAVTDGTAGWMWEMEAPEHREGGKGAWGSTVTAWDPPFHYANRLEGEDGSSNVLDYRIEARGGGAHLRYVHAGVLGEDDWEGQYDGVRKHTAFYLATLKQYVERLGGRPARYVGIDGPESSSRPGSFEAVVRALGVGEAAVGDAVTVAVPGTPPFEAVVDHRSEHFLGLTAPDLLVRVFGREAFGAGTAVSLHDVSGTLDVAAAQRAWKTWLDGVLG
ncbi:SRPBCC family protein [Kineococcus sp. SYSU DK006]|uniref:SRPBCC family protein n=1 Tax=Kineococcus sp. SYSU DK006 TaxID=3383127 RepID=UPI003D7E5FC5